MRELTQRQQAAIFLAGIFTVGALVQWYIVATIGSLPESAAAFLPWIPGGAALLCAHYFGHSRRDLGISGAGQIYWILAYTVPAAAALLVLIVTVMIGIGHFSFSGIRTVGRMIFVPTFGVFLSLLAAIGQEIGWRGFLLPRIQQAQIPAPYLFVGLIAAAWNWPLLVFGAQAATRLPVLTLFLYTLTTASFAIFLGWLRDRSRSVFVPALAVATHFTWLHDLTPSIYKGGPLDLYFGGDAGFLLAILYVLLAWAVTVHADHWVKEPPRRRNGGLRILEVSAPVAVESSFEKNPEKTVKTQRAV